MGADGGRRFGRCSLETRRGRPRTEDGRCPEAFVADSNVLRGFSGNLACDREGSTAGICGRLRSVDASCVVLFGSCSGQGSYTRAWRRRASIGDLRLATFLSAFVRTSSRLGTLSLVRRRICSSS